MAPFVQQLVCGQCGKFFWRHYRVNATRAAKGKYCSRECVALANTAKGDERSARSFQSRIDKSGGPDACWPWIGRKDPNGYGRFDRDNKPNLAHRIAYYLANPDADQALHVCHSCDNPPCCNPSHLWLGTQADNNADRDKKGRTRTGTVRGEDSVRAKITAQQAIAIFRSGETPKALSAKYGITATAVYLIKTGKNWSHVTGAKRAS